MGPAGNKRVAFVAFDERVNQIVLSPVIIRRTRQGGQVSATNTLRHAFPIFVDIVNYLDVVTIMGWYQEEI